MASRPALASIITENGTRELNAKGGEAYLHAGNILQTIPSPKTMSESYDHIPSQGGQHRGEVPEENKESTMNVRAPSPPEPDAPDEDTPEEASEESEEGPTSESS
ncbi:MAG: hypothetical protein ACR2GR_08790 [Rhodothermales bacterium]